MTKQERADNIWVREDIERVFKIGRNTAYGLLRDKTCPSKKTENLGQFLQKIFASGTETERKIKEE